MEKKILLAGFAILAGFCGYLTWLTSPSRLGSFIENNPEIVFRTLRDNPEKMIEAFDIAQRARMKAIRERSNQDIAQALQKPKSVTLDPKKIYYGDAKAPLSIVIYTDLQCPFCKRAHEWVKSLKRRYKPSEIAIVVKHLPLPMHNQARPAAQFAESLMQFKTQKGIAFMDRVFDQQARLVEGEKFLIEVAKGVGVKWDDISRAINSKEVLVAIEADEKEARGYGFTGTPAFVINGYPFKGTSVMGTFDKLVDRRLSAEPTK